MKSGRLWLTTASALVALAFLAGPSALRTSVESVRAPGDPSAQATALLGLVAACGAWAAAGWLSCLCGLHLAASLPGTIGRGAAILRDRLTPRLLTHALHVGVIATAGLSVAGQAAPAAANPSAASRLVEETPRACATPGASPDLDRTAVRCPAADVAAAIPAPATPLSVAAPAQGHVVVPGDSLWVVAAGELRGRNGNQPSVHSIAERWPAWWQANRDVIGPDPALLHPGDALRAPAHD